MLSVHDVTLQRRQQISVVALCTGFLHKKGSCRPLKKISACRKETSIGTGAVEDLICSMAAGAGRARTHRDHRIQQTDRKLPSWTFEINPT